MATALVRGSLKSFGDASIQGVQGRLFFRPSSTAVGPDGNVFAPLEREAVMSTNGTRWDANLVPTHNIRPLTWYIPVLKWLNGEGPEMAFPQWRLFVPPEGGWFDDLVQTKWNNNLMWMGPEEPPGLPEDRTNNTAWRPTDPSHPDYGWDLEWERY